MCAACLSAVCAADAAEADQDLIHDQRLDTLLRMPAGQRRDIISREPQQKMMQDIEDLMSLSLMYNQHGFELKVDWKNQRFMFSQCPEPQCYRLSGHTRFSLNRATHTSAGEFAVPRTVCTLHFENLPDEDGRDGADWRVTMTGKGCEAIPEKLAGNYTPKI